MIKTIEELSKKHGTDKSMDYHGYAKVYDELFEGLNPKKILEIGVADGASVRMWIDAYPNAMIYGIDNDKAHYFEEDRIKVFTEDQGNVEKIIKVGKEIGGNIDIIIHDGSHYVEHQEKSANTMINFLRLAG